MDSCQKELNPSGMVVEVWGDSQQPPNDGQSQQPKQNPGVEKRNCRIRVAFWLDLYPAYNYAATATARQGKMGRSVRQLQHAVRWSVAKKFLRPFCVLLLLFGEGADEAVSILASIIVGILSGAFVDWCMYRCRRFQSAQRRRIVSILFVAALSICAIFWVAVGAFFIASVWDDDSQVDVSQTNWERMCQRVLRPN